MRQPLLLLSLSLAVLLWASARAQNQVEIKFQTDPVLVQTGSEIVLTVLTVLTAPQVFNVLWQYQGVGVAQWSQTGPSTNAGTQFEGRIAVTANQLRIKGAQLRDAGAFTVTVEPAATTGLRPNSGSVQLRVFEAVAGVTLQVPSIAVEGRNVSLSCTWTSGTEITVQWGKGGASVPADPSITISGGSLVINPARRGDAGDYSCTASNPVSAQTATQRLTVYYGPDTPVLTKVSPKVCVGGGDVMVGQTARLTCTSDSLPPALFSWQRGGQAVASGQPDSGVLTVQTFSTQESARYVCTARNALIGSTSQQGTDLTIVATCLDVGEVVGIVIGCLLLILIIVLLVVLIVFLIRRRRAQQRHSDSAVLMQKTNPHLRPVPPDPLPNGARDLGQGPPPPLYHSNTHTLQPDRAHTDPRADRGDPQQLSGVPNADTQQQNGRTRTSGLLPNASQNANSDPRNGIDNRTFTHTDAPNATAQPQNPDVVIRAGDHQVSLNTLQQNNRAQMPTIHVNLTSYPNTGQQAQGENAFPLTDTNDRNASRNQQTVTHTGQSHPRMQSGQSYRSDPRANGHQDQPGLVQTGYTHYNGNNTSQRNANTQTYGQQPEPPRRADRNSWDLLRGTPAYPSGTPQRGQTAPEYTSDYTDYTDYTTHPPIRELSAPNRSQPPPQSRTTSRSRAPPSSPPTDRRTRSRSADVQGPSGRGVTRFEAEHHTQRGGHTQREGAQRDIRGSSGGQSAPGQEATHDNNPQALPVVSRSALPQGPGTQQGPTTPRAADSRALADPNHLAQAHMAQQHRAAPVQTAPQGPGKQTQLVTNGANRPGQGGTAPVPHSSARRNPGDLTQAALTAHTKGAQVFQSRRQQTQAALLHSEEQARVLAARHAPTPPPAIPLAQFQTLPKKNQHRSPARGAQPARPPVNVPVAQRPARVRLRPADQHRRPGDGGRGQQPRAPQPQKHQAPRGRPR
nr:serine/arginine repetitive matrix protein 1 [Gasterosteus aculeatus aculeatus]